MRSPGGVGPSQATMGKIALQLKATLENVTNLRPLGEDFRWYLKDSVALKGGRGSASMVQKCKLCARENSIKILSSTIKSYNAEDNEKFKTIVEFECRGFEAVDFQPQAGFAAEGVESGTVFSHINLQEKDWTDYDEKAQESVGIYEVTHQFVKC
ncbi:CXXC motif containing zinc binding protein-like isoform X1 [Zalophus californianus]|uniref:CXXC motif containing zinc binding protein n=2 Tax=Otariidae TaxID=9702 RepID=A0A6P9FE24_ZALCA|nr:CXXC motif containing zinc binding protein-like isoform X1 [Zalophus californianus]